MAEIETGGPAFPCEGGEASGLHPNPGMTLRDWFAGQALTGMLAHSRNGIGYRSRDPSQPWHDAIAEESYQLADAMLIECTKGKP